MKSKGFPKQFSLKYWVEGPLEGMMELSEDVESYKARMRNILRFGTIVMLSFMAIFATLLVLDVWSLLYPLISSTALLPVSPVRVTITIGLTTLFMAPSFISSLLLLQIWRYVSVMLKRFENVEDLLGISEPGRITSEKDTESDENNKTLSDHHKGLFNILGASSSFTQDIVQNMPQVCKQIKYAKIMLFLMPLYYVAIRFVIPWMYGDALGPVFSGAFESLFEILFITLSILSVVAGILILETGRFMEALYARLNILDDIRNAPLPKIPDHKTPAERLSAYLKDSDKCYKAESTSSSDEYIIRQITKDHIVLAIGCSTPPTIEFVKKFLDSSRNVLKEAAGHMPPRGRFIILFSPENEASGEIGEDVSDYIIANPIVLGKGPGGGNTETVVQIMIEEEGAYGMFPFAQ
jgi:hypothetical protein